MRRSSPLLIALLLAIAPHAMAQDNPPATQEEPAEEAPDRFSGMDEAVNVDLATKAGAPVRRPYIDVESLGELWNLILLMGGGICGFIVGRYWDQIWGRPR